MNFKPGKGPQLQPVSWPKLRRGLLVLVAIGCALAYAGSLLHLWLPALCTTPVSRILDSTRGWQWIDVALNSSSSLRFPASNPASYSQLKQLDTVTFCAFRTEMASDGAGTTVPTIGDDMGLYYLAHLVRYLGFRDFFLAFTVCVVAIHSLTLFAFCWVAFTHRAWLVAFALTCSLVTVTITLTPAALTSWAPWQPYGYTVLFPLLLYVVLENSSQAIPFLLRRAEKSRSPAATRKKTARRSTAPVPTRTDDSLPKVRPARVALWILSLLGCAVLLSIRSDALLSGSVLVVFFLLDRLWFWRQEFYARRVVAVLLVTVFPLLLIFLARHSLETLLLSEQYRMSSTRSHLFWHTIWCSLGEYPNELQFKWNDYQAVLRAERLAGRPLGGYSPQYEAVLREDIIKTLRQHPDFIWRTLVQKLRFRHQQLLRIGLMLIAAVLLLVMTVRMQGSLWIRNELRLLVALTAALLATRIIVVLSANLDIYFYALNTADKLTFWAVPALVVLAVALLAEARKHRLNASVM